MKQLSGTNQNSNKIENVPTPVNGNDAANKKYVDTKTPRVTTIAISGSTYNIDTDTTDLAIISSPTANFTIATSGTPANGQKVMLRLVNGAIAYIPTWGAIFMSSGVAALPPSYTANKTNLHGFVYDSNKSKWVLLAVDVDGY